MPSALPQISNPANTMLRMTDFAEEARSAWRPASTFGKQGIPKLTRPGAEALEAQIAGELSSCARGVVPQTRENPALCEQHVVHCIVHGWPQAIVAVSRHGSRLRSSARRARTRWAASAKSIVAAGEREQLRRAVGDRLGGGLFVGPGDRGCGRNGHGDLTNSGVDHAPGCFSSAGVLRSALRLLARCLGRQARWQALL